MRSIAVIDAETDPFRKGRIPRPFIWGFYDGSRYMCFRCASELAKFLRADYSGIVYAHNGGRFDFHYLLDELEAYDDIRIINGRIASMYIGGCELRDSWLIINEKLAAYQKDEIDYSIMEKSERSKPKNKALIEKYLKSDCVYLWEMCTEFIRRYGNNLTQAGASMKQWVKLSGETPEQTDADFYNAFSKYYYGGRVQCFESGIIETDFEVYDINSAYAYAMKSAKHPNSANYERIDGYAKDADFYTIRCIASGSLPYRGIGEIDKGYAGLSFPDDNEIREYYISRWEHDAAIATKTIKNIKYIESIRFMKHTDFSIYIDKFWKQREECKANKDILGSLMNKLMMNSLYGKFAANPENYHNYMIVPDSQAGVLGAGVPYIVNDGKTRWKELENAGDVDAKGKWQFGGELGPWLLAQRELEEHQKRYYNVATGASVTGFVRAMLWRAIHSSEGVLYCDTDSIAVRKKGAGVCIGSSLGQWKNEGSFDRAGIAGKKLYIFRGIQNANGPRLYKTASKGAKLTNTELWKVADGGSVDYMPEVPTYSIRKPLDFVNPEKNFNNRIITRTAR